MQQGWARAYPKIFSVPDWPTLYDFEVYLLRITYNILKFIKLIFVCEVMSVRDFNTIRFSHCVVVVIAITLYI